MLLTRNSQNHLLHRTAMKQLDSSFHAPARNVLVLTLGVLFVRDMIVVGWTEVTAAERQEKTFRTPSAGTRLNHPQDLTAVNILTVVSQFVIPAAGELVRSAGEAT
jgi:hypothetical protein